MYVDVQFAVGGLATRSTDESVTGGATENGGNKVTQPYTPFSSTRSSRGQTFRPKYRDALWTPKHTLNTKA